MSEKDDCAANGGPTISRAKGCINDEMLECIVCHTQCRWDMTDHPLFGFKSGCNRPELKNEEQQP